MQSGVTRIYEDLCTEIMSFIASFSLECTTKKSENASREKYEIVAYSSLMQEPSVETDSTSCEKLSPCQNVKTRKMSLFPFEESRHVCAFSFDGSMSRTMYKDSVTSR